MARQLRKKSGTGIYHVMFRGINQQDIFEDEDDCRQMLSILRTQTRRYDNQGLELPPYCILYAYCLMSNHIHQNPLKAGLVEKVDDYKWSSWKEYKMDHVAAPLCATKPVLNHFSQQELTELVCTPIEAYNVLDIVNQSPRQLSDDEVKSFLQQSCGIENPLMVQSLDKVRRNEILISARVIGAGLRQLARLTGVSFGVVQKCCKDQK